MEVYGNNGSSDLLISDPDLERQLVAPNDNKEMEEGKNIVLTASQELNSLKITVRYWDNIMNSIVDV